MTQANRERPTIVAELTTRVRAILASLAGAMAPQPVPVPVRVGRARPRA